MITLHKYHPAWGLPDISPFCIKAETYLRMIDMPFTAVIADSRKAPKKKLPYIDDAGTFVSDTRDIIAHFEAKIPSPLDAGISPREKAIAAAFRSLLEEEVYFLAVYQRWQLDEGWAVYLPTLKEYGAHLGIPSFLASLILGSVRKQVVRDVWGQGTGRHTREQVETRLSAAIDAVSVQLGEGPYFLGDRPRTIDATVFAFLWTLLSTPFESRARSHALTLANLKAYCERMRAAYFPDAGANAPRENPKLHVVGSAA